MSEALAIVVAGVRRAVDGAAIRGVAPVEHVTPVPHAPSVLRGVVQVRGEVLPLVDVAGRPEPGAGKRMVLVEADGMRAALLVDGVAGAATPGDAPLDVGAVLAEVRRAVERAGDGELR